MKNMKQAMSTKLEDLWFGKKQIVDPRFLTDDKYHQDHTTIFTSLALNKNCGLSLRIGCYNSDEPSHRWLYPIKKPIRQWKQTTKDTNNWKPKIMSAMETLSHVHSLPSAK
jgi:hypothetical protein